MTRTSKCESLSPKRQSLQKNLKVRSGLIQGFTVRIKMYLLFFSFPCCHRFFFIIIISLAKKTRVEMFKRTKKETKQAWSKHKQGRSNWKVRG